jgi:rsbT co-antagonist protein RsbR
VVAESEQPHRLTELLEKEKERLVGRWTELAGSALRGRLTTTELERDLRELYSAVVPVLPLDGDPNGPGYTELKAQLADLSRGRARQGFTPTETASSVFALKRAVFELTEDDDDPRLFREVLAFSTLLDTLGLWTFETYAAAREEIIKEQSEQLLELTTPVVKLWEGVLAVPLVGTLDSARTQVVMEKLLESLVETGSEHAIIDITGVLAVDTQVAQHLLKTVVAARLMGAECTISGIRPQIAQTIVALGIEFGDITTKATLADALRHALHREGVVVGRGTRERTA